MPRLPVLRNLIGLGVVLLLLTAVGSGCACAASVPLPSDVPWYNVKRPLSWSDLKGRAVLLDFFSPGCINCVHMLPVEKRLSEHFGKRLVIIGVDSPKFTNSATTQGLEDFITQYHLRHPVLLDAHSQLWGAWHVFAWPTVVLVGPDGRPKGRFIGGKNFTELAEPISEALANAPQAKRLKPLPTKTRATDGEVLDSPGGITISNGRVAISDTGHNRVVIANRNGDVKTVIGGACGDDNFLRPHGLTFHDGKLYVADTRGQRISVVDLQTHTVSTLAGSGERAFVSYGRYEAAKASLNSPWDVQWAKDGLYISMAGDHDIWRYKPGTGQIGPWAGNGHEGLSDGDRQSAEFAQSSGLDAHAGTLYVADPESSAIREIALADGKVETLIGQGLFKFGLRNGPAAQALLQHAEDVLWLGGSLYIADTFNNALRYLDLNTDQVTTVVADLKQPQALAALDAHNLLVAEEGGNRIVKVHLELVQ